MAPDGSTRSIDGDANAIGYFYEPGGDFTVDQVGLWSVDVSLVYDGPTSSGPTTMPFPEGNVQGNG